jgi:uncharacterized protein YuzE
MRITYDPEADALYIRLREVEPKDSVDVEEGVTADLDENGHVIGIEFLDARERLGEGALASVSLEQLPLSR